MRVVDIALGVFEVDLKQLKQDRKERSCIEEVKSDLMRFLIFRNYKRATLGTTHSISCSG